jgi:hypothetical protein
MLVSRIFFVRFGSVFREVEGGTVEAVRNAAASSKLITNRANPIEQRIII